MRSNGRVGWRGQCGTLVRIAGRAPTCVSCATDESTQHWVWVGTRFTLRWGWTEVSAQEHTSRMRSTYPACGAQPHLEVVEGEQVSAFYEVHAPIQLVL